MIAPAPPRRERPTDWLNRPAQTTRAGAAKASRKSKPDSITQRGQNRWLLAALEERAAETAFVSRCGEATRSVSWGEYGVMLAAAMRSLGEALGPVAGRSIGIRGKSGFAWWLAHDAVSMSGGVVIGFDPLWTEEQAQDVATASHIVGTIQIDDAADPPVLVFHAGATLARVGSFGLPAQLCPVERRLAPRELAALGRAVADDAPATVIFTSGTTRTTSGLKGFEYTHRQIVASVNMLARNLEMLTPGERAASWLPLTSTTQRIFNLVAIRLGLVIHFVAGPAELCERIRPIAPAFLVSVPRFYEKQYFAMLGALQRSPRWLHRCLARLLAVVVGLAGGGEIRQAIAAGLAAVLRPLTSATLRELRTGFFGGGLRLLLAGSAPTPRWLHHAYHALGFTLLEGYGLTECALPVAMNNLRARRTGSVGRPGPESEIKIEDGEVLVRSIGIARPLDASTRLVDADGYLHTGDLGKLDRDGFLFLTGRKNDQFKTSTGRRIAPAQLESRMMETGVFDRAVVFGANRTGLGAIITIDRSHLPAALGDGRPAAGARVEEALRSLVIREIQRVNARCASYERLRVAIVALRGFSIEGGELTTTQKVRRAAVLEKYRAHVDAVYRAAEQRTPELPVVFV